MKINLKQNITFNPTKEGLEILKRRMPLENKEKVTLPFWRFMMIFGRYYHEHAKFIKKDSIKIEKKIFFNLIKL